MKPMSILPRLAEAVGVVGNRDLFAMALCLVSFNAAGESSVVAPLDLAKPYVERQVFKGKAYFKDNNVWVYTPAFAKTFGMPPENVYAELEGIEAAAFRVEGSGFQDCGYGGKEENCKEQYRCVTDVYIDEARYPLPWATQDRADWHPYYSSIQWLERPGERGVIPPTPPLTKKQKGVITWSSLHPFADPEIHDEVFIGHNGNVPKDHEVGCGGIPIFGYKRNVIDGLSLVSLSYTCMQRNSEKRSVQFQFQSCRMDGYQSKTLKKFHQFVFPDAFERRIDQQLQSWFARDREFYKRLLNIK